MDPYSQYLPAYRVIVCRQCSAGVWPTALSAHLRSEAHELTLHQTRSVIQDIADRQLDLCRSDELKTPVSLTPFLPDLPVYLDGQCCVLDPANCNYICCNEKVLRKRWKDQHDWTLCTGLGGSGASKREMFAERLHMGVRRPVPCQRLFSAGNGSHFFEVQVDPQIGAQRLTTNNSLNPITSAKEAMISEVEELEKKQQHAGNVFVGTSSAKEISPWLQPTRWLSYLDGHALGDAAKLAKLPTGGSEDELTQICKSIDRLVDGAIAAVQEDRVNPFDQMRINSFLQRPRVSDKPLAFKLQKSTYRAYRDVWEHLLYFAHRAAECSRLSRLRHRLTNGQAIEHVEMMRRKLLRRVQTDDSAAADTICAAQTAVDESCLAFCISLLDHTLNGDIYESVIVGFFAVAAIDTAKNVLREAHLYGTLLPGFVKVSQMLVIQRAVLGVGKGEVTYPAELLYEMREKILVYSTRSPFSWACRLRAYAKKVRDTMTSLGFISWTDDGAAVSYKDVNYLTMIRLRDFVRLEVHKAQDQLEELLLPHHEEHREDLGIDFQMHRVTDDASVSRWSWNFLQSERNRGGPLPARDTCLFERVLDEDWLGDQFLKREGADRLRWRPMAVERYKARVQDFLESLLLLIHITGGQPGRGTELTSLL